MFRFKTPDPKNDSMIVIVGKDFDIAIFKWNEFTKKWVGLEGSGAGLVRIVFSDDKGFMTGDTSNEKQHRV